MDNLPLLRDVHLPEKVSPFPPGYGWGIIFGALIFAFLLYHIYKFIRQKSRKHYALRLLQETSANTLESVRQISLILRRICVYKYPQAAVFFGHKWIDFLNQHSRLKLDGKPAELLIYAPYLPEKNAHEASLNEKITNEATGGSPQLYSLSQEDVATLRSFARAWIGENL